MAAPAEITLKNLTGDFIMNKNLSGDFDSILKLQGVGWLTRKGIQVANITLHIKEYDDENGHTHIDIEQTASGGFKGTTEKRCLNWTEAEHSDYIFGHVKGKSRFLPLSDVQDDFLKSGWLPEASESDVIQTYVENLDSGWIADQIWGFEEVNGERRYCRHAKVTKGSEVKEARLVYDYIKN